MGGKKKKYNARFPPARIKKIMQTDEEVGKIAAPVPVVISRALELFLESIIKKSVSKANESNAKTLTSSHIKSIIHNTSAFDFLKSQVALVPDLQAVEGDGTLDDPTASTSGLLDELSNTASSSTHKKKTSRASSSSASSTAVSGEGSEETTKRKHKPAFSVSGDAVSPADASVKPKRKRGRPPKVKVEVDGGEDSPPAQLSAFRKVSSGSLINGGAIKEEMRPAFHTELPPVTAVPAVMTSQAGVLPPGVLPPGMMPPCLVPPGIVPPVMSAGPLPQHRESIFSTDNTLLSNSGLCSPAAHTSNPISRYPSTSRATPNLGLQLSPHSTTTTADLSKMYNNLSPTSQPIDLSTKHSHIQDLSQHNTTTNTLPGTPAAPAGATAPGMPGLPGNMHQPAFHTALPHNNSNMDSHSSHTSAQQQAPYLPLKPTAVRHVSKQAITSTTANHLHHGNGEDDDYDI